MIAVLRALTLNDRQWPSSENEYIYDVCNSNDFCQSISVSNSI